MIKAGEKMEEEQENIIIFPKWKENLEKRAKQAMQEHHYQEAYHYFQQLTNNGVYSHEVMTGKLICMMELHMEEEAEELCELLISQKDSNFAYYVHIYATLLFQLSKYKEVLQLIEDTVSADSVPENVKAQLQQIYQLSMELQEQENKKSYQEIEKQLEEALVEQNDRKQWYMIKRLIHSNIFDDKKTFRKMLKDPEVHPVVKTGILEYYEQAPFHTVLHIEKFNAEEKIHMNEQVEVLPVSFVNGINTYLEQIQQNDPIQYDMIQLILERFMYVYTPFLPLANNYEAFAKSLLYYVDSSLYNENQESAAPDTPTHKEYISMIDMSETLYGSILDV